MEELVKVENLHVTFDGPDGPVAAVRGVSLTVSAGEIFALVGESGCGKSVTAQALLGLHPADRVRVEAETLRLGEVDVLTATKKTMTQARGGIAGMVFQDPMTSLNPTMRVGDQITERLRRREGWSRGRCRAEAVRLLELVRVPEAALRSRQFPHEFSGGMRQRAMLAMALAGNPRLLIADEPTTALDATTQLQILGLIAGIRQRLGTAVVLITHDFGVVANLADRVAVMYDGKIVEEGETAALLAPPLHPYTRELLGQSPPMDGPRQAVAGCSFAGRCPHRMGICLEEAPPLFAVASQRAACWQHCPERRETAHGGNSV